MISALALATISFLPKALGHGYIVEGSSYKQYKAGKQTDYCPQCHGSMQGQKVNVPGSSDYAEAGKAEGAFGGPGQFPDQLSYSSSNSVCGEGAGLADLKKDAFIKQYGLGVESVSNGQFDVNIKFTANHGGLHAFYQCDDNDAKSCIQDSNRMKIISAESPGFKVQDVSKGSFILDKRGNSAAKITLQLNNGKCSGGACFVAWAWSSAGAGAEFGWFNCITVKSDGSAPPAPGPSPPTPGPSPPAPGPSPKTPTPKPTDPSTPKPTDPKTPSPSPTSPPSPSPPSPQPSPSGGCPSGFKGCWWKANNLPGPPGWSQQQCESLPGSPFIWC